MMQPAMASPQYQQQQQQQWLMMNQQLQQQQHLQQQQQQPQQQQQVPQQQLFQPHPQQPVAYYYQQPPPQAAVPPQYQTQQQPQYTVAAQTQPASSDEIRSLWIGNLQYWMDEQYLISCFGHTGEVVSAKVISNRQTSQSEGYGFIEFVSHAAAERNLQAYNGTLMPNAEQNFRLNWASFGVGEKRRDDTSDFTIFVGDLAADVTDYMLLETFRAHYPSAKGANVVTDRITGRTKGYGFVRFGEESEQLHAMTEMNGRICSTRPMRIGPAANKKDVTTQQPKVPYQNAQATQNEDDPNNTTIFVGGLDPSVTDEHLRQLFGRHGQLVHVKIPVGKRCGFVQFADRSCAEEAIRMLSGTQLGGQNIRLSWGRGPSNKQMDSNQQNGGYYGYPSGYEAYGYGQAAQDPSQFYGGYAGYGSYPQPQQQTPQPQ